MNVYDLVTDEILSHLENGIVPWRKTWRAQGGPHVPVNFTSGKAYRGVNVCMLAWSNFSSNSWLTYKQAQSIGAQVRKGEKSRPVVFWSIAAKRKGAGDETGADESKGFTFAKLYHVFNVEQCDGITAELPLEPVTAFDPIAEAQAVSDAYFGRAGAPTLRHGGDRACYAPLTDTVSMPDPLAFTSADEYYSTLFHEAAHSTMRDNRLDRSSIWAARKGDANYAREELLAEFSAAFLCGETGIKNERNVGNSAAYIAHWLKVLKNDRTLAVSAAQRAQRVSDYILGREFAQASSADLTEAVAA